MNVTQPGQFTDKERRIGMSFKRITVPMEVRFNLKFPLQRVRAGAIIGLNLFFHRMCQFHL